MNLPLWPRYRLILDAHIIRMGAPKLAIHSNITPGKLGPESEHVLMLDYDGFSANEVRQIMLDVAIEDYFLLPTEHGFHVVHCASRTWDEMRLEQILYGDHDLHSRKTGQYGRAALALHPYKGFRVGRHKIDSGPHFHFYNQWIRNPNLDWAKSALAAGNIAFRLYNKFEVVD